MQVAIIGLRAYPASFSGTSGVEVYCEQILKRKVFLRQDNFEIFTRDKYQKEGEVVASNIKVTPLLTISSKVFETIFYSFFASCLSALSASEVIWYHGVGPALFAFIPRIFGKKILLTVHSADWQRRKWSAVEKKLFFWSTFLIFKTPHKLATVSQKLVEQLHVSYQVLATYAPPGMFNFSPKNPLKNDFSERYILYLGRVVPEKRVDWLLKAFTHLEKEKKFSGLLVIAGGHGNSPQYELMLKKKYPHHSIKWIGYVFGRKKEKLIRDADSFILPSELEGNSISLLEAISMRKKCLVADSVIENEMKMLSFIYTFPTDSYLAFVQNLKKIVQVESTVKGREIELEKMRRLYSWEKTANIYKTLLFEMSKTFPI